MTEGVDKLSIRNVSKNYSRHAADNRLSIAVLSYDDFTSFGRYDWYGFILNTIIFQIDAV